MLGDPHLSICPLTHWMSHPIFERHGPQAIMVAACLYSTSRSRDIPPDILQWHPCADPWHRVSAKNHHPATRASPSWAALKTSPVRSCTALAIAQLIRTGKEKCQSHLLWMTQPVGWDWVLAQILECGHSCTTPKELREWSKTPSLLTTCCRAGGNMAVLWPKQLPFPSFQLSSTGWYAVGEMK